MFRCHAEFGVLAWGCAAQPKLNKIFNLQKKCVRNVANTGPKSHTDPIFAKFSILKFNDLFKHNVYSFLHKFHFKKLPMSFNGFFQLQRDTEQRQVRENHDNYVVSLPLNKNVSRFPRPIFAPIWNGLSDTIKATGSHSVFKRQCKEALIDGYETTVDCENLTCEYCHP